MLLCFCFYQILSSMFFIISDFVNDNVYVTGVKRIPYLFYDDLLLLQ